jgi:hypothetical protein
MKLAFLPVVVLLLALPPVFAFNCNLLNSSQQSFCNDIMNSDFSTQEKDALMTLLVYTDREKPNHELVSFWNQQIKATTSPQNVSPINKGTIRNAWMKVFGVMPSVYDSALYVSDKGILQTEYNYTYQLPTGTASGDCKTDYSFYADRTFLNLSLNGKQFGNSRISNFDSLTKQNITFNAALNIKLDTKISHYKNTKYCCLTKKGSCIKWCTKCAFSSDQIITDELILSDNLPTKLFIYSINASVKGISRYSNNTKGELDFYNVSYISLIIDNSSFHKSSYVYDFNYSFSPYNFITLRATQFNQENTNGLFILNKNPSSIIFLTPNPRNCTLRLGDHFNNLDSSCTLNSNQINISVKSDKFYYNDNETINLTIIPNNVQVRVLYANKSYEGTKQISLIAVYPNNKISIFYNNVQTDIFVSVINQSHWFTALNLIIFFLMNFLIYKIIVRRRV